MKIIAVDNFNRETHDDKLICENVNTYYAKIIVEFLNNKISGDYSDEYFKVVEDDYTLYKYEW